MITSMLSSARLQKCDTFLKHAGTVGSTKRHRMKKTLNITWKIQKW